MRSGFCLFQIKDGSSCNDFLLVLDIIVQHLLQVQNLGLKLFLVVLIAHQRQHDDAEGILELCVLIQLIQDNGLIGVALELNHNADTFFKVCFIAEVCNALHTLFLDQFSDFFHQLGLIDHVRDLGDNDLFTAFFGGLHLNL